ncbi:MAG: PDZ domain-containing protein [Steroidobacteraceae bacterium]
MGKAAGFMACALCSSLLATAFASPGPEVVAQGSAIPAPRDRPYPGAIELSVDARDVEHRVFHVRESLDGVTPGSILLYPKWLPGTHAPQGPIDRFAGLTITAAGAPVSWTRDTIDMYAIRLHAGPTVHTVEIQFDYLSPTSASVGALEVSPDVLMVDWNEVVLYPASYFSRQIPVTASVNLPAGWQFGTALETAGTGVPTSFKRTDLETLVDSPVYAGRYAKRIDLESGGPAPVHLDLFADRPDYLVTTSEELQAYRALVQQAFRLFGSHHFDHYDFLYSLSDQVQQQGLEHHRSSENGNDPESFTKWDATAFGRDLLPHEFTHSWNGKFRRPADLWTPNYDVPMQNSLLWVYEGQTQYWGQVLTARSGLWTLQQALDQFALTAAYFQAESGRRWRPLQDTTNDEIINPRRPQSWRDWQRFEDYYEEGKLIWLEADTLIRELSGDRRSLDDFARAFFGIDDGSFTPVTYTFDDVVRALNSVQPYDWSTFLRQRLDSSGRPAPLEGLRRGGYRLVYTDTPSEILKADDEQRKHVDLLYSIGVRIDDSEKGQAGMLKEVMWDGAAAKAGLTEGAQILAVNGIAYGDDVLKDAIRAAKQDTNPIELIVRIGDRYRVARVDYHGGLRYPHLERNQAVPARLDQILAPRP